MVKGVDFNKNTKKSVLIGFFFKKKKKGRWLRARH